VTLSEWLAPRLEAAPTELAAAIRELLREAQHRGDAGEEDGDASTIPGRLGSAALWGLDAVSCGDDPVDRRSPHGTALRLLAADAALTYAFEAAADLGGDVVGLAVRLGPRGALGARLTSAGSPEARGGEVR
jgi:hypothetical protein